MQVLLKVFFGSNEMFFAKEFEVISQLLAEVMKIDGDAGVG